MTKILFFSLLLICFILCKPNFENYEYFINKRENLFSKDYKKMRIRLKNEDVNSLIPNLEKIKFKKTNFKHGIKFEYEMAAFSQKDTLTSIVNDGIISFNGKFYLNPNPKYFENIYEKYKTEINKNYE